MHKRDMKVLILIEASFCIWKVLQPNTSLPAMTTQDYN